MWSHVLFFFLRVLFWRPYWNIYGWNDRMAWTCCKTILMGRRVYRAKKAGYWVDSNWSWLMGAWEVVLLCYVHFMCLNCFVSFRKATFHSQSSRLDFFLPSVTTHTQHLYTWKHTTHTILYFLCIHEWVFHSEPHVPTSTNRESYLYLGVARGLNRLINISWLAWFMSSNLQIVIINRASFKHAKVVRSDSSALPDGVGRTPSHGLLLLQEWWGPRYSEDLKVNNPSFVFLGLHVAWRLFFQWKHPELDLLLSLFGRQEETPAEAQHHSARLTVDGWAHWPETATLASGSGPKGIKVNSRKPRGEGHDTKCLWEDVI